MEWERKEIQISFNWRIFLVLDDLESQKRKKIKKAVGCMGPEIREYLGWSCTFVNHLSICCS